MLKNIFDEIYGIGIVPVVVLDNADDAVPLAKALLDGGLPCAEVTFRTAAAAQAIQNISEAYPQMLVGAGTVLTVEQVDQAVAAGAKFIVAPGLNPTVVSYCVEKHIPVIPGCATPSEIEQAMSYGLSVVKFFPAEACGGVKMLKAVSAPYGKIKFMPTGGINADNLGSYLAIPQVVACGGSWMVDKKLIASGSFDEIKARTKAAVAKMLDYKFERVVLNAADAAGADSIAYHFTYMFDFARKETENSILAGNGIEVAKQAVGTSGQLVISVSNLKRAVYHLNRSCVITDPDTAEYDAKNNMTAISILGELNGFTIRLEQK